MSSFQRIGGLQASHACVGSHDPINGADSSCEAQGSLGGAERKQLAGATTSTCSYFTSKRRAACGRSGWIKVQSASARAVSVARAAGHASCDVQAQLQCACKCSPRRLVCCACLMCMETLTELSLSSKIGETLESIASKHARFEPLRKAHICTTAISEIVRGALACSQVNFARSFYNRR